MTRALYKVLPTHDGEHLARFVSQKGEDGSQATALSPGCPACRGFVLRLTAIAQIQAFKAGVIASNQLTTWDVLRKSRSVQDDSARAMLGMVLRAVAVVSGSAAFVVGEERYRLHTGDMLIHTPDLAHGIVAPRKLVAIEGWLKK